MTTKKGPRFMTKAEYDRMNEVQEEQVTTNVDDIMPTVIQLKDFLREFNLDLSPRLLNSLVRVEEPSEYLLNYALLTGRNHLDLNMRMESREWQNIEKVLKEVTTNKKINNRFILYFGAPGTGKTTKAQTLAKKTMIMHENITSKELLYSFDFDENGHPTFKKTALAEAMENGEPIVLDEINLAPLETLHFLQGILDNKDEIVVDKESIKIKDGFKVIGTMNEEILGVEYYLPEPLIDRTEVLKKFVLTPGEILDISI